MNALIILLVVGFLVFIAFATWKAPRLTSALFWSLLATVFTGTAILILVPVVFSEKFYWLTVILPLIWAGYIFWIYWERRSWLVVSSLISITLVCGTILMLAEPLGGH